MRIAHIACIALNNETGMGRIASNWKRAFEAAGHTFIHIGRNEVPQSHMLVWGKKAAAYCRSKHISADVWLVHEPFGGDFTAMPGKLVVFSHGIEERAWNLNRQLGFDKLTLKARLLPDAVRFHAHRKGFKHAALSLLSNSTDRAFLERKHIASDKIFVFKNGFNAFQPVEPPMSVELRDVHIVFNGTWIPRKGIDTIVAAMNELFFKRTDVALLLIGTVFSAEHVLQGFHNTHRNRIRVLSHFAEKEEAALLQSADIFLLPSYLEGQSVALTQAMAMGLCPVVSDNSGQIDFVHHQKNGMLFQTGNHASLVDTINFLLDNKAEIVRLGSAAADTVRQLHWENVTATIVQRIEAIVCT